MNRREFLSGAGKVAALPLVMGIPAPVMADTLPYDVPNMTVWGKMSKAEQDHVKVWIMRHIKGGYWDVTGIIKDGYDHVLVTRIHRPAHSQSKCPTRPRNDDTVCTGTDRIRV